MKLKENFRYAVICPTSMGVRITPDDRQPVHISRKYTIQATSAETNVLNVPASLGMPVKALTAFVEGSPIAAFIKAELRSRGIDFEGPELPQNGPWGLRHQFNIADSGFGLRGARVHNDRAGEVGRLLQADHFDLTRIFHQEGAAMLHISGLIAALSPQTSQFCLQLAKAAHEAGTVVSFDLNHRASFWQGRETELSGVFNQIAHMSDILIGNEEDFQLCLGLNGPETGGKGLEGKLEAFKAMIGEARLKYTGASVFATTLREVISANDNLWGAVMLSQGQWFVEEPRPTPILDRIGGGDGFVSGLLYAMLKGWPADKQLAFGWAAGALATASLNDYATPADEDELWSIYSGNARIRR